MASSPRRTPRKQPSVSAVFQEIKTARSHRPSPSHRSKSQGAAASLAASGTPSPKQTEIIEEFWAEIQQIISDLSQQLVILMQTSIQDICLQQQGHLPQQHEEPTLHQELPTQEPPLDDFMEPELNWSSILDDLQRHQYLRPHGQKSTNWQRS
jgi:hypothetical protein